MILRALGWVGNYGGCCMSGGTRRPGSQTRSTEGLSCSQLLRLGIRWALILLHWLVHEWAK